MSSQRLCFYLRSRRCILSQRPRKVYGLDSILDRLWLTGTAKHLEPLKGGKYPLEVLVRGKDAAENEKLFSKITDTIKSAGVSHRFLRCVVCRKLMDVWCLEEGRRSTSTEAYNRPVHRGVEEKLWRYIERCRGGGYLLGAICRFGCQG